MTCSADDARATCSIVLWPSALAIRSTIEFRIQPPFIDPEAETFITALLFIILLIPAPLFDKGAKLLTQVTNTRIGDSVRSANFESTEWDRKLEN